EPGESRRIDDDVSAGAKRFEDLTQDANVVVDVLEDVEQDGAVEPRAVCCSGYVALRDAHVDAIAKPVAKDLDAPFRHLACDYHSAACGQSSGHRSVASADFEDSR